MCLYVRRCALANLILRRKVYDGLIYLWSRFIFWMAHLLLCQGHCAHSRFVGPMLFKHNECACSVPVSNGVKPCLTVIACILIHSSTAWLGSNLATCVRLNLTHQCLLNIEPSSHNPANTVRKPGL